MGPIKVLHNMLPNNVLVKQAWEAVVKALEVELRKAIEDSLDHKLKPLGEVYQELDQHDLFVDTYINI